MKIIRSKGLFAMIGEEEKPHIFIDNSEKYRKALEEIREIVLSEYLRGNFNGQQVTEIENKINEVLGAEDEQ